METIIKISPSELSHELIDKIQGLIGKKKNVDVTISLKEFDETYVETLNESLEQATDENNLITFSMEDFMSYTPAKKGK